MKSIRHIFKIGYGPSSSHTMGPRKAAELFLSQYPDAFSYRITLYGSLAATGKGHLTHQVLHEAFAGKEYELLWEPQTFLPYHPNAMKLMALNEEHQQIACIIAYSVGGGDIVIDGVEEEEPDIYDFHTMDQLLYWCQENGSMPWEYVEQKEDFDLQDYMTLVWQTMKASILNGLEKEGHLPGGLHLSRKAGSYYVKARNHHGLAEKLGLVFAYALAVAEENASGGKIVTAPTCGSSGVLPATLYAVQNTYQISDAKIIRALETAGIIGNLVKYNASISGAEVGCQGEIGTACAMTAGAVCQLIGGTPSQIEYAAEMGMEHHLGLTCDPILGLVQIPCIERNAFAAERAYAAATYAMLSDGLHRVSFDQVIATMGQTGRDMCQNYRETSKAGLAVFSRR